MLALKRSFCSARSFMRNMGLCAGVDIEPAFQTEIADASEALPGVLCAGVPGAGGCDALFALYIQSPGDEVLLCRRTDWS